MVSSIYNIYKISILIEIQKKKKYDWWAGPNSIYYKPNLKLN